MYTSDKDHSWVSDRSGRVRGAMIVCYLWIDDKGNICLNRYPKHMYPKYLWIVWTSILVSIYDVREYPVRDAQPNMPIVTILHDNVDITHMRDTTS